MGRIRLLIARVAGAAFSVVLLATAGCSSPSSDDLATWSAKPRANSLVNEDVNRWRRMVREGSAPQNPDAPYDEETRK